MTELVFIFKKISLTKPMLVMAHFLCILNDHCEGFSSDLFLAGIKTLAA